MVLFIFNGFQSMVTASSNLFNPTLQVKTVGADLGVCPVEMGEHNVKRANT
jgi:hypothetical protein